MKKQLTSWQKFMISLDHCVSLLFYITGIVLIFISIAGSGLSNSAILFQLGIFSVLLIPTTFLFELLVEENEKFYKSKYLEE